MAEQERARLEADMVLALAKRVEGQRGRAQRYTTVAY